MILSSQREMNNQQKCLRFAYPPLASLTPKLAAGYTANPSRTTFKRRSVVHTMGQTVVLERAQKSRFIA